MPQERSSNIEVLRIIAILIIIAHHFVFHSGFWTIPDLLCNRVPVTWDNFYLLSFGWGGKMAINIFLLITGYFMSQSNITAKKFLKLLFEILFYKVGLFLIFVSCGKIHFSVSALMRAFMPIGSITTDFLSCYLFFFLLIPFLNKLIHALKQGEHAMLLVLLLGIYTLWCSLSVVSVTFNYITWFSVVYLIGAYIRLYPHRSFESRILTGLAVVLSLGLSWGTIPFYGYYFSNDANRILAVTTAVSLFLFFRNLNLGHSRFINTIASATFGVLLIHDNGYMRENMWTNMLHCVENASSHNVVLYSLTVVFSIYVFCVIIDLLRQYLFEKPFFSRIPDFSIPFLPKVEKKGES